MFRKFIFLCFFALSIPIFLTACSNDEEKPDIKAESFLTDKITVYSDGYFGLQLDQPVDITDPVDIEIISHEASKVGEYFFADSVLEGLNGVWIDFNNGTVISMYYDENYGNVSDSFLMHGDDENKNLILPERLNDALLEVLPKYI